APPVSVPPVYPIKEFDFPHKRSRMVMADRHHFFTEVGL
ncbi:hypothetical protein, partial [Salmonella enterica]